jgi:hypothetical protein
MLNPDAIEKRQDFNYNKTPNSSLEIQERLLSLGLENVKVQMHNDDKDLNNNMQIYGKNYIFDLLKIKFKTIMQFICMKWNLNVRYTKEKTGQRNITRNMRN